MLLIEFSESPFICYSIGNTWHVKKNKMEVLKGSYLVSVSVHHIACRFCFSTLGAWPSRGRASTAAGKADGRY